MHMLLSLREPLMWTTLNATMPFRSAFDAFKYQRWRVQMAGHPTQDIVKNHTDFKLQSKVVKRSFQRSDRDAPYRVVGDDAAHDDTPHFDRAVVATRRSELLIIAHRDARDGRLVALEILQEVADVEVPQLHHLVFRTCHHKVRISVTLSF